MSTFINNYGCGIFDTVFGRRPKPSASTGSLPTANVPADLPITPTNKKSNSTRQKSSEDTSFDHSTSPEKSHKKPDKIIATTSPNQQTKNTPPSHVQQVVRKGEPNEKIGSREPKIKRNGRHYYDQSYGRNKKVPQGSTGISGELEAMIDEQYQKKYAYSNMKIYGNLGNLQQSNSNNPTYYSKTERNQAPSLLPNGMGNVSKKPGNKPTSFCRALSTRMDPEKLKIMGNEDYKNGRFAEALSLYEAAIAIDPGKASYRSNKSAALTGLGRLLEAVFEAKEAIRIEPFYQRAHNRLATLYLRLGDVDKIMYHYKQAGSEVEPDLITRARNLRVHLNRCNEAKMQRDWNTLLKEINLAISVGADSALQIYALKVEALLKLHRHQEADQVLLNAPKFEVDDCTKFYGPIIHANFLVIRAQVDLATGRMDDAMEAAQMAVEMDSNNKDVNMMVLRTRAVMCNRSKGNEFFKANNYIEASNAYGEGLDHDPFNSVLLCNRAACQTKLGQFQKAIEDCTVALNIRPSYTRARLRRADCNAKLGKWQEAIDDYEFLAKEAPEDEGVTKALREAKKQLKNTMR